MDVKVAKRGQSCYSWVPIFDVVAVILLMVISQFSIPMLMGIIFGSIIAVLNFRLLALTLEKSSKSTTRKGTSIYWR